MASLTKIMTYIVAYENIPDIENAQITIPQSVVDELSGTGSSVATFDVGETYTGLDMLYLMMVPSGNNAALTLAKYVDQLYAQGQITGGNVANAGDDPEATTSGTDSSSGELAPAYGEEGFDGSDYTGRSYFVDLMNQKAQELAVSTPTSPTPTACTMKTILHRPGHGDHRQIRHEPAPLYRDHRHHLL